MRVFKNFIFSFVVVFVFFGALEFFLHIVGFRYQRGLSYMRFGYPNPVELHQVFELDPELLFRLKPNYDFGDEFESLNSQGFRGKDFSLNKVDGSYRVACLGDSVTFGNASSSYPQLLELMLRRAYPSKKIEVYNFGVPGYSSFQGKKLLREVLRYRPDLVVVLYGWNDHWLARGFSDSEQRVSKSLIALKDFISQFRTYQFLNYLLANLYKRTKEAELKPRVSIDEYYQNLMEMIEYAKSHKVVIILCTSPAGFSLSKLPDFLEELEFVKHAEELPRIHHQYNEVVKRVAKEKGVQVVDLELLFRDYGVNKLFDHPELDVIHPNLVGMNLIAEAIFMKLKEEIK